MTTVLAVVGPTASGKSDLALALAERIGGLVLSVDSMQVYRGMDIGTAKPSRAERARVRHEMIDVCDPEDDFSVAEFQRQARSVIRGADQPVVIAGGSGLHFRAVVDPLDFPPTDEALRAELEARPADSLVDELTDADPTAGLHVDLANPRRVIRAVEVLRLTGATPSVRADMPERLAVAEYRPLVPFRAVGLDAGAAVGGRIDDRLGRMRAEGLVDEVRRLRHRLGRTAAQAVGYKELIPVVDGHLDEDAGFLAARTATEALVKRQRTYLRPDPRIAWLDWSPRTDAMLDQAMAALELT